MAALAVGAVAVGGIPSASGEINGCYKKNSGKLRVIDTERGGSCRHGEVAISWSERGPAGPPGPPGPPGPQGPPGAASNIRTLGQIVVAGGDSRVLLTYGPITFTGICTLDNEDPINENSVLSDQATVVVSSTERLAWLSEIGGVGPQDPYEHELVMVRAQSFQESFTSSDFVVQAEGGASASGIVSAGTGNFGRSRSCLFGGYVLVDS